MNWIPEQPKVGVRVVNDSPPSIMDIIPKTAREQWADDHCCASDAQIEDHQRDLGNACLSELVDDDRSGQKKFFLIICDHLH